MIITLTIIIIVIRVVVIMILILMIFITTVTIVYRRQDSLEDSKLPHFEKHRKDSMVNTPRMKPTKANVESPCGVGAHLAARDTSLSLPSANAFVSSCSCSAKATATDTCSSWNLSAQQHESSWVFWQRHATVLSTAQQVGTKLQRTTR